MGEAIFVGLILLLFCALLGAYCLYVKTLQDALRAVSPPARRIKPGQAWLMLIPVFSFIYSFIMVDRLATSVAADLRARGAVVDGPRPTYAVGRAMSVCQLAFILPDNAVVHFVQIASLVLWIIHWVQVAGAERKLRALPMMSAQEGQIFAD